MGPSGTAAVSLWVLVTVSMVVDTGLAEPRRCLLSHYRWLEPRALAAVRELRDHYEAFPAASIINAETAYLPVTKGRPLWADSAHVGVQAPQGIMSLGDHAPESSGVQCTSCTTVPEEETLSWGPRNCSFRPRRNPPPPSSCARLRLVARGLSDAQDVLSSLPRPDLFPGAAQTLELLVAARRDVAACLQLVRPGSSRKPLRPRRRRPKTRRASSPQCHQANVIFNLLRLLTWDLKLVAHSGPCL